MANVEQDCVVNQEVDLIIQVDMFLDGCVLRACQAGDHAYNQGQSDERRGDGYMEAWQQTLARCPWMPVVGNHEVGVRSILFAQI